MTADSTRTGAHALVDALHAAGVRTIFSLSGNQIMPVYDAVIGRDIRLVHVRHEAAAVYMAEAWAQLTGEVGVALVTAGAGLGNALGALISARASETPVLLLSGDSARAQDGMGAFQELDQAAMSRPVAKWSGRAGTAATLAEETARAIAKARQGRPGPVHLALPVDALEGPLAESPDAGGLAAALAPGALPLGVADAARIAALLAGAERPLVLTGPALSASRSGDAPARLAAALDAPVLCMESPRGLRDPSLGALAEVTRAADVVMLLAKAPDFTTGFLGSDIGSPDARIVVIDPEAEMLDRAAARLGSRLECAVQADAGAALEALCAAAASSGAKAGRIAWRDRVAEATARRAPGGADSDGRLHPATLCAAVEARLKASPGAVLIVDGGEFGQWGQTMHHSGPRVINGVSGAIGAAPAYAIAASIARPDVPVYALMGDGTAGFLLAEYETAVRENTRFVAVIGNDDLWNAEHQIQIRSYGANRTHSCNLTPAARYDLAATAFGAFGALVDGGDAEALRVALQEAETSGRPACVNVLILPAPAPVAPSAEPKAEAVH